MEPTLPTPSQPETRPQVPISSSQEIISPVGGEIAPMRPEKVGEMQPVQHSVSPQVPTVQPVTTAVQQVPQDVPAPVTSGTPQIADDVDVIEKEWIDKAKKIVSATKEDPHMQEKQVSELQADYLMKRYNKQVKIAE